MRPDTRIPFMAMPDAIDALLRSGGRAARAADAHRLQPHGVQPDARSRFTMRSSRAFPGAVVHWETDDKRQASSIRGPRTWTTGRRAATGASRRCTISRRRSTNI